MPSYRFRWAYMDRSRLITSEYVKDNPKQWIDMVERDLLKTTTANINLEESDGWQVRFENVYTAAVAYWLRHKKVRAVTLMLTGVSDYDDALAVFRGVAWSAPFCPAPLVKALVCQVNRPAAIHIASDQPTFNTALV